MLSGKKRCMRLDITKMDQADEIELGDKVTFVVTGTVVALRGPEEGYAEGLYVAAEYEKKPKSRKKEKYTHPGEIKVEVESAKISRQGEFDDGEEY